MIFSSVSSFNKLALLIVRTSNRELNKETLFGMSSYTSCFINIIFWIWIIPISYCTTLDGKPFQTNETPNLHRYKASYLYPAGEADMGSSNVLELTSKGAAVSDNGNKVIEILAPEPDYELASVDDYERAASEVLPELTSLFFNGGSDERITLDDNVSAFKRYLIKPRALVDVSQRKLFTNILGYDVEFPLGVSPTAFLRMASPEGEIATAKAAEAMESIFILSTYSNTKIEDITKAAPDGRKWMQVYMFTIRSVTVNLVRRAEQNGFEAIVVTVDSPVLGNRVDLRRLRYDMPNTTLANFGSEMPNYLGVVGRPVFCADVDSILDASATWEDIRWLKSLTVLPVIVKGILNPDDAERVIQYGLDGIYVSNHGGRQLDDVESTIDVLPEIVKRVGGRCPVVMDGGFRTGRDIFKALALGADMVFAGRPFIWGNAVNGESGVTDVFNIFKSEFNTTMALAGVRNVAEITEAFVGRRLYPAINQNKELFA